MVVYPSLEDMVVDHHMQGQRAEPSAPVDGIIHEQAAYNEAHRMSLHSLYPTLGDENAHNGETTSLISPERANQLTQYYGHSAAVPSLSSAANAISAPLTSLSPGLYQANLTHGVRNVFVPKDNSGKIGIRFVEVNKGIFVQFVMANSEAARQGIRFGDQILQMNGKEVFGISADKLMQLIGKVPNADGVVLAVRDRPYCRVISLHKDQTGHLGFGHKENKVISIVKESSASRNGLTINQAIIEVDGISVVAYDSKEVAQTLAHAPQTVSLTIMPWDVYQTITYKIDKKLLRQQDHSVPIVNN